MKNSRKPLAALVAFAAFACAVHAQPAVKLMVVDMAKLYDNHYKTVEQNAKIQADDQKATDEVTKMNAEGNALVEEYKGLADKANNPALTADAKTKAQAEAQKKYEEIQRKQQDIQGFIQNTRNSLGQRFQTFKNLMLEEISKTAGDIAKRKGGTILIDKSGPTGFGISNIVYADAAYDITDEVMKELNKDRPANAPTAPVAAPAATTPAAAPAAAPAASPGISVPGLAPAKK